MMPACVVDTDVISYLFKSTPEGQLYRRHLAGRLLIISFMTVAELHRGVLHNNWGATRIAQLEAYLSAYTIHHSDEALCRGWAQVTESERRKGRIISTADAWIAATAILNSIPLVSHNRRHYAAIEGLALISEG